MPRIELTIKIAAPIELVFDLSRDIDVHQQSQTRHREQAVAGRTSGLINEGEEVTWEAVHFGVRQQLRSHITKMQRPVHFQDVMISGAFKRFEHDHFFTTLPDGRTLVTDVFDYTSPFGPLGKIADALFLKAYMHNLLTERNALIKHLAESSATRRS